jgi:hypothetical protein
MDILRFAGYANVPSNDPWNTPYELWDTSGTLIPASTQDVWVCSEGANLAATDDCPGAGAMSGALPGFPTTPQGASVGYSAMYGAWTGS